MAISSLNVLVRVPLGPLTVTVEPSIVTSTPDGTGMGCLPIRDTACRSFRFLSGLPDVGDDFAADAGDLRLLVGHDAVRGGDHGDTETAEHAGKLVLLGIHAKAGLGDAADTGDGPLLLGAELEGDLKAGLRLARSHVILGYIALFLHDAGDLHQLVG